jgi:chemotaxis protein MotA
MSRKHLIAFFLAVLVLVPTLMMSGDLGLFFNPAGLLLVMGGTLLGVYLAYTPEVLKGCWRQVRALNQQRVMEHQELRELFVRLTRLRRVHGDRALEAAAHETGNHFLELGVSLVADQRPSAEIRQRLEQEFDFLLSTREAERAVLNLMGRLAPAFGLAGTVVGLIRMLHSLKDPGSVASGMSVALLTTFYGIMVANLMVLPLERKLRERNRAEAVEMTIITEGIMGLAADDNGAAMDARLGSYRLGRAATPAEAPASATDRGSRGWVNGLKGMKGLGINLTSTRSAGHER